MESGGHPGVETAFRSHMHALKSHPCKVVAKRAGVQTRDANLGPLDTSTSLPIFPLRWQDVLWRQWRVWKSTPSRVDL